MMKKNKCCWIILLIVFILLSNEIIKAQKLDAEDLIIKHLESIGSKEKRADIKNQMVFCNVEFKAQGNVANLNGKALILSNGKNSLWGMNFNSNDYPQDRFAFDGKEVKTGFTKPGIRSILSGFILSYKELLKDGLLGGTLSANWTLLDTNAKKAKVTYEGTKSIDGRETYVVSYLLKSGSDLDIKMYFDKKTYQHLRTEYSRVIAARQGRTIDSSASQASNYYKLTEDFSDFQTVNGLTIPKKYKIHYSSSSSSSLLSAQSPNRELDWIFDITNLSLNQTLDNNAFDIDAK